MWTSYSTSSLLRGHSRSTPRPPRQWIRVQLEAAFDRPGDLAKFIRYDYASRHGSTTSRRLYRAIQDEVQGSPGKAKKYVQGLADAQVVYSALREPESDFWVNTEARVKDALYAYRRFGFEASFPALLAAYANWPRRHADKLLVKMAKWSVRAQVAGSLGGGTADDVFGAIAAEISAGTAKNQTAVRELMDRLIPNDEEFKEAFIAYGDVSISRAKYLLAMLDKADDERNGRPERPLEWHARSVTIEHILPLSKARSSASDSAVVEKIGNLALLEKRLNKDLGSADFAVKRVAYRESSFGLTAHLATKRTWSRRSISQRTKELAELACFAWPNQ